jgi:hypothetical protein
MYKVEAVQLHQSPRSLFRSVSYSTGWHQKLGARRLAQKQPAQLVLGTCFVWGSDDIAVVSTEIPCTFSNVAK